MDNMCPTPSTFLVSCRTLPWVGVIFKAAFKSCSPKINCHVIRVSVAIKKPVQLYSKLFMLFWYLRLEHHSTLKFHNYFIQCQIFCGVVQCG